MHYEVSEMLRMDGAGCERPIQPALGSATIRFALRSSPSIFRSLRSHHMEKTEVGLKGLRIRKITVTYNTQDGYIIILRLQMPWRSAW